jgi:SpoVK/Ycf46/Vps4 family AAA+-type ATPase
LTWLNDKTARIFVVATANDVAVLPPEFLRRGRFDEIFYVDFPNVRERESIFMIHLCKALKGKIDEGKITRDEIRKMAKAAAENKKTADEIARMQKELAFLTDEKDIERAKKDIEDAKKIPATDGYAGPASGGASRPRWYRCRLRILPTWSAN